MDQKEIDTMVEALRAQGLTWSQTNFAVSLVRNAVAAERERCAKKAAPEHIPFSDDEWRVRCEIRDSILEA